jgi:hypothetical protein
MNMKGFQWNVGSGGANPTSTSVRKWNCEPFRNRCDPTLGLPARLDPPLQSVRMGLCELYCHFFRNRQAARQWSFHQEVVAPRIDSSGDDQADKAVA